MEWFTFLNGASSHRRKKKRNEIRFRNILDFILISLTTKRVLGASMYMAKLLCRTWYEPAKGVMMLREELWLGIVLNGVV